MTAMNIVHMRVKPGKETEFLDLTNLEALQWQVVTDQNDPHTVTNLCIESISWF